MPSPALEMQGISKRFAGVQALQDVSLVAYPGEVLALIRQRLGAGRHLVYPSRAECFGQH